MGRVVSYPMETATKTFEQALPLVRQQLEQGWRARPGVQGQRKLSTSTIEQYLVIAKRFDRAVVPLLAPEQQVRTALEQWRTAAERLLRAERLGPSSVRIQVSALRVVYSALQVAGLVHFNPASYVSSASVKRGLPRPMEPSEVEALCRAIDCTTHDGRRHRALMELLLHNLRRAEAAAVTTADIQVRLPNQIVLRVKGKGEKERLVPMHPAGAGVLARFLLDEFRADEWRGWLADFAEASPTEQVLCALDRAMRTGLADAAEAVFRVNHRRASVRWVNRVFAKYRDAAHLSGGFGPHSLRHTFGTELLNRGEDLRVVQELMGHEDIRSTTIYTKVALSAQAHATQKLPTPAVEETWITTL